MELNTAVLDQILGGCKSLKDAEGLYSQLLQEAKTAEELRIAQAVLLPLVEGLSLEQTASVIGRGIRQTCALRRRFIRIANGTLEAPRSKRALRNRAYNTLF